VPPTNLKDQLIRDEGCRTSVYQDDEGWWTIGIGICVDARKKCGLYSEEIDFILNNRIAKNATRLSAALPWTDQLDQVRRDAVLSMVFQMGLEGVIEFSHFLDALQDRDYPSASQLMLDSKWARVQSPDRAKRLSQQILTGQYQ
jgi:GH24 family phage-related lysozyme (muramidase)